MTPTDRPTREDAFKDRALHELKTNQQQLDMDGIMVGVSRQALDEMIDYIERTRAGIVIDRDKVPMGKVLIDETEYRQLKNIQAVIQEQIDNYAALLAEKVGE